MYKSAEARYVFQDKYFGRKVTISDFPAVLASFLSNGSTVLSYHIPLILRQLYRLAGIVHTLDRFRFYAASLLFIYDGDAAVQEKYEHSLRAEVCKAGGGLGEDTEANDPDRTEGLSLQTNSANTPTTTKSSSRSSGGAGTTNQGRVNYLRHYTGSTSAPLTKKKPVPGAVIIRLIDFAHCTTGDDFVIPSTPTGPTHSSSLPPPVTGTDPSVPLTKETRISATFPPTHPLQPDLGFLLGLKSLCAALRMIWAEEVTKEGVRDGMMKIEGEDVFDLIFGEGALQEGLGEGKGADEVWEV